MDVALPERGGAAQGDPGLRVAGWGEAQGLEPGPALGWPWWVWPSLMITGWGWTRRSDAGAAWLWPPGCSAAAGWWPCWAALSDGSQRTDC